MTVRWEWQLKDSLGSDISHFLIQARGDIFKNWSDSPVSVSLLDSVRDSRTHSFS